MNNDNVIVVCYGKETEYAHRQDAINEYMENIAMSEGSEKERYTNVLLDLLNGLKVCKDGD